jgi:predicted esterase
MLSLSACGSRASIGGLAVTLLVLSGGCSAEADNTATLMSPTTYIAGATVAPVAGTVATPIGTTAGGGAIVPRAGTGNIIGVSGAPGAVAGRGGGTGVAGVGAAVGVAGTVGAAAGRGGSAGMAAGAAGSVMLDPGSGPMPVIPAIKGDCPEFKDGSTIMVAGHKSIVIAAGAPGKGGPLLVYWHGTGGTAAEVMRSLPAAVRSEIIAAGGIIAAFNGSQSSGTGRDCSGTAAHNMADFDATDQIAACAVKNHGINPRRIYTTGCSAGGLQAGCMAQMRSSYLAASAPNSGGVVANQPWQDKSSPAIFTMHGGSSDMVIVTFSQTSATLDMSAKAHGSFVVNCNHGGGHCGAPAALQSAAWQFMKDHPFGFGTSPWTTAIPAGVPDYCKIY